MMKALLPLLDVKTSNLPKLAVLPVQMQGGATNQRDADTLAQILAIYMLRNKSYAIYPRTSSLEKVQEEFKTQRSGVTADKNAVQLGYGVNPEYVLSVASRKLGEMNMFNAAIIDLAAGTQLQGISENYGTLADGIAAMESIAKTLSRGRAK
jgi:Ca2+-dependent lipid-binding protein